MAEHRKDSKGRVLREGESERKTGGYQFRYPLLNGKRCYLYARTLTELREKEELLKKDQYDGIRVDKRNLTLNGLFEIWKGSKTGIAESTSALYENVYNLHVRDALGGCRVSEITRSMAMNFVNRLSKEGMSYSRISTLVIVLHQTMELALDEGYVRSNPFSKLSLKPDDSTESPVKALTVKQQSQFFDYLLYHCPRTKYLYPIFSLMVWTGLRVGEALGLMWNDIDFEGRKLKVNRTLRYIGRNGEKCRFNLGPPKTKSGYRTVPLLEESIKALKMEREFQRSNSIKCSVPVDEYTDFVFLTSKGKPFCASDLNRYLKRIVRHFGREAKSIYGLEAVELPIFSTHMFRHTFATRLVENNVNIKVAQKWLGHSSIKMTMDVYAAATEEFQGDQAKMFEESMRGMPNYRRI